ncbi:MAG: hypothetical protein IJE19_02310 [Clostridia bacterium]|nr:hypothetical protein [Clostridia bacterium]
MDNNLINNAEENTVNDEVIEQIDDGSDAENSSGNKLFRGILTAAVSVSFVVFVYLLIYFCENTGV